MKSFKRIPAICIFLLLSIICTSATAPFSGELNCKSAVLMEASTGRILFDKNPDEALPPASVTKVMTLLLVAEAIDAGKIAMTDTVCASEHAASMGGSQVFLKAGEEMSVEEMVKSVVIASANDCAVALAEFLAGSEDAFVAQMNARAAELGMEHTHFQNTNGLDDTVTEHKISAEDIAIMSRALIAHSWILDYSSIWMDSIRGGAFGLTNTNRLIRFYPGANGLKTGSTSKAGFCISATAKRDEMQLIAVIMGAPTRDIRNEEAKKLLDYGFANYGVFAAEAEELPPISVRGGVIDACPIAYTGISEVLEKEKIGKIRAETELLPYTSAPVRVGDVVGSVTWYADGEVIGTSEICATESVDRIGFFDLLTRIWKGIALGVK